MPDLGRCIYCWNEVPMAELTLEHIWPDALGGDNLPAPFKTKKVCKKCNNLCGLFVDGAFIKSWSAQSSISTSCYHFLDPLRPSAIPLIYVGIDTNFPTRDGEICERWLGPAGDHIFHIHQVDDEKWYAYAGGDILRRKKKDRGRAYIALTSKNPFWQVTALASFREHFKHAKRCVTNIRYEFDHSQETDLTLLIPQPDPDDKLQTEELDYIRNRTNYTINITLNFQLGFDTRFLCKLALGIGGELLGEAFLETSYAKELRKGLWCKNYQDQKKLLVRGSPSFSSSKETNETLDSFVGIKHTWTLLLNIINNTLGLTIVSPDGKVQSILITDQLSLAQKTVLYRYEQGLCFILLPTRTLSSKQGAFGPISLTDVINYNLGYHVHSELARVDKLRISLDKLPPKMNGIEQPATQNSLPA